MYVTEYNSNLVGSCFWQVYVNEVTVYMFLSKIRFDASRLKAVFEKKPSLSTYFPEGTTFYYGYPAGEDSGFLNNVPPASEEIVAARARACAGPNVSVICFASSASPCIKPSLFTDLSIPQISQDHTILLPESIDTNLTGHARNEAVKKALSGLAKPGSLIMAQPYTDPEIESLFQIPPSITTWLNDKSNMKNYISEDLLPKRYAIYPNGAAFANKYEEVVLPAVIKASSSSSGDGVYICRTKEDVENAVKNLGNITRVVLVEQFIDIKTNYAIHFGIPHDKKGSIDIIGINEQLTTPEGEFIGGFIRSAEIPKVLHKAVKHLQESVLPKVREMGWYGIGGIDILCDSSDNTYFIDPNFRITGMSAFHFMIANNSIKRPLVGVAGEFEGSEEEFEKALYPYTSKQSSEKFLQLIAISKDGNKWRFNGAISFKDEQQLKEHAGKLISLGVKSQALSLLVK